MVSCKDAVIYDQSDRVIGINDISLECNVAIWYQTTRKIKKGEENMIHAYQIFIE